MAGMKIKNGAAAVLLPVLLMTGAAMLAGPSPVFAGFEMKSYAPPAPAAETAKPAPATVIPPAAAAAEGEVLPGFGSGLPLAIALQQVAPAGYQFSFAAGVNPGTPVSWAGGKPWQRVLADMLSPQRLGFNVQNNVIIIDHLTGTNKPTAPAVTLAAIEQQLSPAMTPDEAETGMVSDEEFFDETEKLEPIVTRRNNRRASISTRRDFVVTGQRTWLERFKGRFKKHEEAKAEKAKVAAQQKEIAAQKGIQWDSAPAAGEPAQKAAPVEAVALGAPQGGIRWSQNAPMALAPVPPADNGIVSGFGSEMPLAIALQQVVPSGYDLSFSPGIDKNIAVSWNGGKPWKQVLTDMLSARQLNFRLEDNIITIDRLAGKARTTPVAEEKWLPPVSLTKPEAAAATPVIGQPANAEKKEEKEKTAAAPVDSIVSRRNSIAGRSGPDADQRSWLERFRDRFGFKKGEQNKEAPPVKAAEEAVATEKMPEEKVAETKISSRRAKPAEMPPAMEVAPPPAAVAAAEKAPPEPPKPVWLAPKDKTLKDVLSDWSKTAGVELYWSTDYDYRLNSNIAYSGSFDEAVGELLGGFADIRPQPYGQLHQVVDGSRVLVVNTY